MNFICAISNTLIKPKDRVRIIFLESQNRNIFPFMNGTGNFPEEYFIPISIPFKATFIDNNSSEFNQKYNRQFFNFDSKNKHSYFINFLLNYINENIVNPNTIENNNINENWVNSNFRVDLESIEELFQQSNSSCVYLKNKNFVKPMIILEEVYQIFLQSSNINKMIKKYKEKLKTEEAINMLNFREEEFLKLEKKLHSQIGTEVNDLIEEEVLIDDEVIKEILKEKEFLKNSKSKTEQNCYLKLKKILISDKGKYKRVSLRKNIIVDEKYIQQKLNFSKPYLFYRVYEFEVFCDLFSLNERKYDFFKNTFRDMICQKGKILKMNDFIEIFHFRNFIFNNGFSFLPSRKIYSNCKIKNKKFYQKLIDLDILK